LLVLAVIVSTLVVVPRNYAQQNLCLNAPNGLNLRQGQGTGYRSLALMPNRSEVILLSSGVWSQITYNGVTGYAHSSYLGTCGARVAMVTSASTSPTVVQPAQEPASVESCSRGWVSIPGFGSFTISMSPLGRDGWGQIGGGDGVIYHLERPTVRPPGVEAYQIGAWMYLAHNYTLPGRAIRHLYYNGGMVCINGRHYNASAWMIMTPSETSWMMDEIVILKTTHEDEIRSYLVRLTPVN
jgi:uncharacterized protein YraI